AAHRPGGDVGEQQYRGGDGERQRAGQRRGGRVGDDHGHERGAERDRGHHGDGADGPTRHRRQRAGDDEHLGAEHRATAGGPGHRDAAERHRDAVGGRAGRGGFWAGAEHGARGRRGGRRRGAGGGGGEGLGGAGVGGGDRARGAGGRGDGQAGLGERGARADGAAHRHAPGRERQSVDRPGDHLAVEQ